VSEAGSPSPNVPSSTASATAGSSGKSANTGMPAAASISKRLTLRPASRTTITSVHRTGAVASRRIDSRHARVTSAARCARWAIRCPAVVTR
jgi:hypothetical protein